MSKDNQNRGVENWDIKKKAKDIENHKTAILSRVNKKREICLRGKTTTQSTNNFKGFWSFS